MKRFLPLALTLVFAFMFVFTLTFAFAAPGDPIDPIDSDCNYRCCTYTTWCGSTGSGSTVWVWGVDQLGKPYRYTECVYLWPGQECYNFKCNYQMAAGCVDH